MVSDGKVEFTFNNEHGEPCGLQVDAGRETGRLWIEDPSEPYEIRGDRLAPEAIISPEEFEAAAKFWHQATGRTLQKPLRHQVLDLTRNYCQPFEDSGTASFGA